MTNKQNEQHVMVRTIESQLAIAKGIGQHEMFVTTDIMQEILSMLKEKEPIPPKRTPFTCLCGKCSAVIYGEYKCCPFCGQEIMWNADITD